MKLLQELFEATRIKTPWARLNDVAKKRFGEFGFATLDSADAASLVNMRKADSLAKKEGETGLMTMSETDMKKLINKHPELLKKSVP